MITPPPVKKTPQFARTTLRPLTPAPETSCCADHAEPASAPLSGDPQGNRFCWQV
ncbi:MAG: hypothetical protein K0R86_1950, partial [Enterobacter kobei]|nr:hypothetical protein [Enterobacter kobei]